MRGLQHRKDGSQAQKGLPGACPVVCAGEAETGFRRKSFGAGQFGRDNLEILTAYLMDKERVRIEQPVDGMGVKVE